MLKAFKALLLIITLSINLHGEEKKEPQTPSELAIQSIANINMQTFEWTEWSWTTNTFLEWVTHIREQRFIIEPRVKRSWAFKFFKEDAKKNNFAPSSVIKNSTPWLDLNFFRGGKDKTTYVANSLDRTQTELGKMHLYKTLAYPTKDVSELLKRQEVIKTLAQENRLRADIVETLKAMKESEDILLGFWDTDSFKNTSERFYFNNQFESKDNDKALDFLNKSETALLAKNLYQTGVNTTNVLFCTVGAAALLSYGALKIFNTDIPWISNQANAYRGHAGDILMHLWEPSQISRFTHGILAITIGLWCGSYIRNSAEYAYGCILIEQSLQEIMRSVAQYTMGMRLLEHYVQSHSTLKACEAFKPLHIFFEKQTKEIEKLNDLMHLLRSRHLNNDHTLLTDKGIVLRAFALMHVLKEEFCNAIVAVGALDMYTGLAQLVTEHTDRPARFCFATYAQSDKPLVNAQHFWHPIINPDIVIPNSLTLGTNESRPNGIITGPNEGGKSTMLKSLAIALIMAQSLGIAPADALEFTPFHSIETYLNITDDISSGNSLFKAEVCRAGELISRIEKAQPNEFSFVVFDEVFNGTSPVEGSAAAYSIAKHMSAFNNSICLIATHFPLLTQLETDTQTFTNYKVVVDRTQTRSITYPRRLEHGVSDQHVALDILHNQGFAGTILDDAQRMVEILKGT